MEEAKINLDYQDAIAVNALKDKIHSTAEVDFEEKPKELTTASIIKFFFCSNLCLWQ